MDIIILAAGLGTRMKSELPKVLHRVCGEAMLSILLQELDQAIDPKSGSRFNIVVGHGRDLVKDQVKALQNSGAIKAPVVFTVQEKQLGTGHAVRLALENPSKSKTFAVFNGDLPLFTTGAFNLFVEAHTKAKSVATLGSALLDDAGQYGRVVRKGKDFVGVVEFKDASAAQRKIKEFNGGVYLFERDILEKALSKMNSKNAAGEFYLPDVFAFAKKNKKKILAHLFDDVAYMSGVNNMKELAEAQKMLHARIAEKHMIEGVFIQDPATTFIGRRVKIGKGTTIGPLTTINGESVIGQRVQIGAGCELKDVKVGDGSVVKNGCFLEKSSIGRDCSVGPMAHFRPNSHIKDNVKVGNFVELKEATLGNHTAASHLSYIGDAEVGEHVNIGCGFVTCNYDGTVRDGRRKHLSQIGDHVFIGSDSQVVAPIEIASGTYIASGSTVTESVKEKDSLVIARTRQVTKPGYAKKYRNK